MQDLHGALSSADFVLLAVPLLPSTRGLFDTSAFDAMKPGAVLMNVARGGIVDKAALVRALDAGRLRGAALDVFATEPLPSRSPLWDRSDVIVTPLTAAVHEGWEIRSVKMFAENLARYRNGLPLANIIDLERGY